MTSHSDFKRVRYTYNSHKDYEQSTQTVQE
jgi:hypothetical protein